MISQNTFFLTSYTFHGSDASGIFVVSPEFNSLHVERFEGKL
jgi:hypothetical protein